jgi:ABC-type polysaccharide/polyol phosphate export permease
MKNIISVIIFIASTVLAFIGIVAVSKNYDKVWFEFVPMFLICVCAFSCGFGIWISALVAKNS